MTYSHEVEHMCVVKKGPNHGPAPIPEEGKWVKSKEIVDISGLTHGIGWCAPQQGACKLPAAGIPCGHGAGGDRLPVFKAPAGHLFHRPRSD